MRAPGRLVDSRESALCAVRTRAGSAALASKLNVSQFHIRDTEAALAERLTEQQILAPPPPPILKETAAPAGKYLSIYHVCLEKD